LEVVVVVVVVVVSFTDAKYNPPLSPLHHQRLPMKQVINQTDRRYHVITGVSMSTSRAGLRVMAPV